MFAIASSGGVGTAFPSIMLFEKASNISLYWAAGPSLTMREPIVVIMRISAGISSYILKGIKIVIAPAVPTISTFCTGNDCVATVKSASASGSPVEIEFAVDLTKDNHGRATFYLLQIKPLIGNAMDYNVNIDKIPKEKIMLYAEKSMGNGVIDNIEDVIFVDIDTFDKGETMQMTYEIEEMNRKFAAENKKYLLIGPGRWGTRDRWIGIPVNWAQISHARVIIETSLEGYPLDASSGSHFFHNVVSMNVGYFSIQPELSKSYIRWEILKQQPVISQTKYFRHIRFDKPLTVSMDGKKRIAVVTV